MRADSNRLSAEVDVSKSGNRMFSSLKLNTRGVVAGLAWSFASLFPAAANASLVLAQEPLFLVSIPPISMVMLDNSGSMKVAMYRGSSRYELASFDPTLNYHGMFDESSNYVYDSTVPVNTGAYTTTVDSTKTGAFYVDSCTPSSGNSSCWSGKFLNWLTTRRIDSARQVLVGGKVESTTAFNYGTDQSGTALQYKLVGNNEPEDDTFTASSSVSSTYSPIPNDTTITVASPAETNNGAILTSYDPYPKLSYSSSGSGSGYLYNSAGNVIGEFGRANVRHKGTDDEVTFLRSYTNPIAVAGPSAYNGADPGGLRIYDKTSTGMNVYFEEWYYIGNRNHTTEEIHYLVVEAGTHILPGGQVIKAGDQLTTSLYAATCGGADQTNYESISLSGDGFTTAPVVFATVSTYNGAHPVQARAWDVTTSGFKLAMQEERNLASGGHGNADRVDYIAVEPGSYVDAINSTTLEVGSIPNVTSSNTSMTFTSAFGSDQPAFIAGMQTMNETHTASLRATTVSSTGATIFVDEEQSCGYSSTAHTGETVGYLAALTLVQGNLNVALAVPSEPMGIIQDLDGLVRLGLSFYRFNPNVSNIYTNSSVDGGTLRFKIPLNPFVKDPDNAALPVAESGYREVEGYVGASNADLVDAIRNYPLVWGTTPLAENLWEVLQYFEQDDPHYFAVTTGFPDYILADTDGDGVDEDSTRDPYFYSTYNTTLHCAPATTILITDGAPFKDANIPSTVRDYDGDSHSGDVNGTGASDNREDNLDDVAYWGFCDTAAAGDCPDSDGSGTINILDAGNRDLRADIINDQAMRVHTVVFAGGTISQVMQDTADNAGGNAYAASDGLQLASVLNDAFTDTLVTSSAASAAIDTGVITGSNYIYLSTFSPGSWSGELKAYALGTDGSVATTPTWSASSQMPTPALREIFTHNGSAGVPFTWANLTTAQKADLNDDSTVLDYLRGDQSNENNVTGFRERVHKLGDLVHSAPLYIGAPNWRYPDNWNGSSSEPEDSVAYSTFVANTTYANRTSMIYVGGNDGMLHAFNAATGVEEFAYVPTVLFDKLADLTEPSYAHQYYVDGSPSVLDAFFNSGWHTVLVGALGAGGQGIFALDVTLPGSFNEDKVLWEFDDSDDIDMGYSFSQPNIVRMQDSRVSASTHWAAVIGNGYLNTKADGNVGSGTAVLYILDIEDGSVIKKIDTGVGSTTNPNGLTTPAPVDINGDWIIDYIYAGDLYGNLWKFDVSNSNKSQWGVAFSGSPLFKACAGGDCSTDPAQPITTRPLVADHPQGTGYMVYFGTGRYIDVNDDASVGQVTQSIYGVWDREGSHATFDRDHLLKQEILAEVTKYGPDDTATTDDTEYRIVSANHINWHSTSSVPSDSTTHLGWYMDLYNTENSNTNNYGERAITNMVLRDQRLILSTMVPTEDPCSAGGTGWNMDLDITNGGRLDFTSYDVDGDGVYDIDDFHTIDLDGDGVDEVVPLSGRKSKVGIPSKPSIVSLGGEGKEASHNYGSGGEVETIIKNPGLESDLRQSWRQLY